MNIFILDKNPAVCAKAHCDNHVVKMTLESAQILSSALTRLGVKHDGYSPTHLNHPCVRWATDLHHFVWLRRLGRALAAEYTHRYGKVHKSLEVINSLPIPEMTVALPTRWALAMPVEYHEYCDVGDCLELDPVASYRAYYCSKLGKFPMRYTNAKYPSWLN